jgi:hypothetical protein
VHHGGIVDVAPVEDIRVIKVAHIILIIIERPDMAGQDWRTNPNKRILMDNGAYQIKYSTATEEKARLCYNAVGRDKKTK